jgi:four helix bundle protein
VTGEANEALATSKLSKLLPRDEQFELGRQLRRSARSIAANIVEGWTKRNSAADFKRHLLIAAGETAETKFWIGSAVDVDILPPNKAESLIGSIRNWDS